MQTIKLKKGLDIPFEGTAAETLGSVRRPEVFHIVPDQFAGITPKLDVKVGDRVKAGSPLFHDKAFESLFFTSPVSGEVKEIVRGERRKIMSCRTRLLALFLFRVLTVRLVLRTTSSCSKVSCLPYRLLSPRWARSRRYSSASKVALKLPSFAS